MEKSGLPLGFGISCGRCCNENIKYAVKPKPLDHQTSHSVNCQSEPNVNLCNACVPGWIEGQATNTWGRT